MHDYTQNVIRRSVVFFAALVSLVFAVSAGHADRPSLGRVEAVMCQMADLDGRTYRPPFCTPQCTCDVAAALTQWTPTDCTETTPGEYTATVETSPLAPGTCQDDGLVDPNSGFPFGTCVDTPGPSCSAAIEDPFAPIVSVISDCPIGQQQQQFCRNENCTQTFLGACITWTGTCFDVCSLSQPSTCPDVIQPPIVDSIQFSSVGASDAVPPATCTLPGENPVNLSSSDAAACITTVEAALGQACTPAP